VSIVRVGLAETKNFAEGYDVIFGNKKGAAKKAKAPSATRAARTTSRSKAKAKKHRKK
jgi:ribosomal protein L9